MRLLFTGGGGSASEALHRLLSPAHEVHFADADVTAQPSCVSADHWHYVPQAWAVSFVPALTELCQTLAVDVLIPGVDEELLKIVMHRPWFGCPVLLPEDDLVATHPDKLLSMRTLKRFGIAVPVTERLRFQSEVRFPCVVKPRFGRGSKHVAAVRDVAELKAHVTLSGCPEADFIVQEGLQGQEYTVTVVADRQQRLRAIVPVKVGLKKGVTLRAVTDHDPAVTQLCRDIHAAQPFSGVINVQCIKAEDGSVKPFEINPRVSTTTCLAIAAGVDVIGLYLDKGSYEGALAPFTTMSLKRSWQTAFAEVA